jgi:hypothetical protein
MSTGIAGEPVRGSTRYPVPIVTAILAVHAFRELPWNQLSALALAALALCAVALLAAYRTIAAALWFRHQTEELITRRTERESIAESAVNARQPNTVRQCSPLLHRAVSGLLMIGPVGLKPVGQVLRAA